MVSHVEDLQVRVDPLRLQPVSCGLAAFLVARADQDDVAAFPKLPGDFKPDALCLRQ
jgi:hypothetical protein